MVRLQRKINRTDTGTKRLRRYEKKAADEPVYEVSELAEVVIAAGQRKLHAIRCSGGVGRSVQTRSGI